FAPNEVQQPHERNVKGNCLAIFAVEICHAADAVDIAAKVVKVARDRAQNRIYVLQLTESNCELIDLCGRQISALQTGDNLRCAANLRRNVLPLVDAGPAYHSALVTAQYGDQVSID